MNICRRTGPGKEERVGASYLNSVMQFDIKKNQTMKAD